MAEAAAAEPPPPPPDATTSTALVAVDAPDPDANDDDDDWGIVAHKQQSAGGSKGGGSNKKKGKKGKGAGSVKKNSKKGVAQRMEALALKEKADKVPVDYTAIGSKFTRYINEEAVVMDYRSRHESREFQAALYNNPTKLSEEQLANRHQYAPAEGVWNAQTDVWLREAQGSVENWKRLQVIEARKEHDRVHGTMSFCKSGCILSEFDPFHVESALTVPASSPKQKQLENSSSTSSSSSPAPTKELLLLADRPSEEGEDVADDNNSSSSSSSSSNGGGHDAAAALTPPPAADEEGGGGEGRSSSSSSSSSSSDSTALVEVVEGDGKEEEKVKPEDDDALSPEDWEKRRKAKEKRRRRRQRKRKQGKFSSGSGDSDSDDGDGIVSINDKEDSLGYLYIKPSERPELQQEGEGVEGSGDSRALALVEESKAGRGANGSLSVKEEGDGDEGPTGPPEDGQVDKLDPQTGKPLRSRERVRDEKLARIAAHTPWDRVAGRLRDLHDLEVSE